MKRLESKENSARSAWKFVETFWRNLSIVHKLYVVVGTMTLLILFELLTLHFAMNNLSAVRSFVGGEGSWSKGQKRALYFFQRYVLTHDEKDYLAINEALKIPEGDRVARIELLKDKPNYELAYKGLIAGKIHPEDLHHVVNLLRRFYWVDYISKAIEEWRSGDELIEQFKQRAAEYHSLVLTGGNHRTELANIMETVNGLNEKLSQKEEAFSSVLSEGARWLEKIVFMSLIIVVITVECVGLTLTLLTSRAISKGLGGLNKISEEYGAGNFDRQLEVTSKDEIGTLTGSINRMGSLLKKSYSDLRDSHAQLERKVEERTSELEAKSEDNKRLYNQAKEALTMRDEFLSIANHELRTPLTSLILQLRVLERNLFESDERFNLNVSRENIKNANRLVRKLALLQNVLMDLTKIQLGKFELKTEKCDLALIINDCVSQLSIEAGRSGSTVDVNTPAVVYGDFDSLRAGQVFTNLLTNAIKYGEGKPIEIKMTAESERVIVQLIDNGPGIPYEKQEQIFERFERASSDTALSGLGLGLYISKQIVEAHGGHLSVNSIPGSGSCFTAEFPLS